MSNGIYNVPIPKNEPIYGYAPGSPERQKLKDTLAELRSKQIDMPLYIGNQEIRTDKKVAMTSPHDHQYVLGHFYECDPQHVTEAIEVALEARHAWSVLSWEHRLSIFLKAAELSATKYRYLLNASTMLGQSKNAFQAEIDAACEWVDFLRFNVAFATEIYRNQPISPDATIWNKVEYRPLEGFVYALTPFNFTAISGNLPVSAAMMGNVVVWKPAPTQMYSAYVLMQVLKEAGVPAGVINLIQGDGPMIGDLVFSHPEFAGIHFTGSTAVFKSIWKNIGSNMDNYRYYPRIVGETGGKDFMIAHESADVKAYAANLLRAAFEFQGQKCSAASRAYIPVSLWDSVWAEMKAMLETFKVGGTEDFSNFVNAVIDQRAFQKITGFIDRAKENPANEIIWGGTYDDSKGWFVDPTIILTNDPHSETMEQEIFGPVLTIYLYEAAQFEETLSLIDRTSPYALTGAVFAQDRYAVDLATRKLVNSAGNFYINDKCTGAVVGQQPFGGARGSGTNDKAGSMQNLLRWVSARTIKEGFIPATDYRYPFLAE
ncbi:L-glutamate gamma-semialdehyde dehydrogenase [Siphonobacter sp. SORGH_AS_1065]|uniref:L-glutamate gamma-semialdehyde dehydrogenase n=1 Tax=Siphonobacter sp. SORGH_AS_1065 TaxID=3041795 RepID=UPI00277E9EDE|nr:L-glutamate gamma-semialdehyde dehydrogenase [Siphonobacter sp. SORGH_AS_1065]MDQ1086897.1 1-pyrroline-5-carboxylate dehydrogenase [Siphonobacter sp. SORGH_AS_1065]